MSRFLSTAGLARLSARRPWTVLGLWLVLLVLAGVAQTGLSDALTNQDNFTNKPESVQAEDRLEDRLRGERPLIETVIVQSDGLTVDDPAFRTKVETVQAALLAMPEAVRSAGTYYDLLDAGDPAAANLVNADRTITIIPVTMVGDYDDAKEYGADYVDAIAALETGDGFSVATVGDVSGAEEFGRIAEEDLAKGEGVGILAALVVLVVVFGALVAAGVPLILALVSIFVALGLTALVGQLFQLSDIVTNMITMIGLAVGIDYALFIVERYREERRRGHAKHDAIELAGATASKAVLFSGGTVILALLGMFLIPVTAFRSLGIGAALVVVVAVAATLTLVPALLSLLGDRINWPRRARGAQPSAVSPQSSVLGPQSSFWGRVTRVVMAHPAIAAGLAIAILVAASLPVANLKTGQTGIDSLPDGEVKRAYAVLEREFYAGMVSPVEIVVDGPAADPAVQESVAVLTEALAADGDFGPATVTTNPAGDLTLVSVPVIYDPNSPEAENAVKDLREEMIPAIFAGAPAEVFVGGGAAFMLDFNEILDDYTPIVFAFVLGLSFLLLLLAFRSIVVPIKAILVNLLSVSAAYGLIVLVFQEGIGADLLGFQQTPVIEAWLPIFLFSVLFGLSMDYHVFLLSRIKEHFDLTKRNGESVAVGLQSTGRIITGAAIIMVAVFSGFAAGRLVTLQQMGFGLAVAVFLDATIVRSILVPAGMALLGDRNWYFPRWLGWLPNLHVEGVPPSARPVPMPDVAPAALPLATRRVVIGESSSGD